MDETDDDAVDYDTVFTCWCGAKGTHDELFDDSCLDDACGGSGTLHCYCGGDLCVCHHHGETECPGCIDCEEDGDDDYDPDDYEPDPGESAAA